jgi:UrcA family protein
MNIGSSSCRAAAIERFFRLVRRNSAPGEARKIAMTKNSLAVAVSALAILGFATGVRAASPSDSPSIKVSLTGVDLGSQDGAKVALQRISRAAQRVCGEDPTIRTLDLTYPYVTCVNATVDHAVGVLDSPRVTALNAAAHGKALTVVAANRP